MRISDVLGIYPAPTAFVFEGKVFDYQPGDREDHAPEILSTRLGDRTEIVDPAAATGSAQGPHSFPPVHAARLERVADRKNEDDLIGRCHA